MIRYIYAKEAQEFIEKNKTLALFEALDDEVEYCSFEENFRLNVEDVTQLVVTALFLR